MLHSIEVVFVYTPINSIRECPFPCMLASSKILKNALTLVLKLKMYYYYYLDSVLKVLLFSKDILNWSYW